VVRAFRVFGDRKGALEKSLRLAVSAGAVLMGEVIRAQHRGKAVGSVQSGWAIGWAVAAAMATLFFSVLPQDTAWRALFWVGVTPAFFVGVDIIPP
jgi:MFS family permease